MRNLTALTVLGIAATATAQNMIPIPLFGYTWAYPVHTRGFWFQTPVAITIVGLRVPDEAGTGVQSVELIQLSGPPPSYPTTATGGQRFYANNRPSSQVIPCAVSFNAGDHIGVLGACGTSTMHNSEGGGWAGPFASSVLGRPVTLTLFGTQTNLSTSGGNQPYWQDPGWRISRVEVYLLPTGPGIARIGNYGTGCYDTAASFYELFLGSTDFDLSNSGISMVYTGTGYDVVPALTSFVAPSPAAVNLGLTDDSVTTRTLSGSMPFVGGSTSSIEICSNGWISPAGSNGAPKNPDIVQFLNGQPSWRTWHDYAPTPTNNVMYEEVAGVAIATWNAVPDFFGTVGSNSTFQFQLDIATGNVHLIWRTMSASGTGYLVGWTPGGGPRDPGNRDLSTSLPFSTGQDRAPLTLNAMSRPITNTSCNLMTARIPAGSPFGAVLLGFTQYPNGIPLAPIGAPDCFRYTDGTSNMLFIAPGATDVRPVGIPNDPGFIGMVIATQSAVYSPGVNVLNVLASNGTLLTVGNW
jgi:hypothetical protein